VEFGTVDAHQDLESPVNDSKNHIDGTGMLTYIWLFLLVNIQETEPAILRKRKAVLIIHFLVSTPFGRKTVKDRNLSPNSG